jgi:hypothetical protein
MQEHPSRRPWRRRHGICSAIEETAAGPSTPSPGGEGGAPAVALDDYTLKSNQL